MLLPRSDDAELRRARGTTKRVARTFAIACRMLPRDIRDVTRDERQPSKYSIYMHVPSGTEPGMAAGDGDSI